jgi:BirA family biotin operon repressor/biotin-[acetyl-CoA-carboxylase] ligase
MATPREEWALDTAHVGRRVLVFGEVASTNTLAAGWPHDADGLAFLAENQTAGRGRFDRTWQSRPGSSLLLSVVLAPPPELRRPSVLTAWAALAVAGAVYELTSQQARIKWPNDLLVRGKKVCGILIEQGVGADADGNPRFRTVVGIGLNLMQTAEDFAAAGLPDATSLLLAANRVVGLRAAAETVVRHLDAEYGRLLAGERVAVEADWKWRTGLLGRQVVVELTEGPSVTGRVREMGFAGLEVTAPDGTVHVLVPERIAHIRPVG